MNSSGDTALPNLTSLVTVPAAQSQSLSVLVTSNNFLNVRNRDILVFRSRRILRQFNIRLTNAIVRSQYIKRIAVHIDCLCMWSNLCSDPLEDNFRESVMHEICQAIRKIRYLDTIYLVIPAQSGLEMTMGSEHEHKTKEFAERRIHEFRVMSRTIQYAYEDWKGLARVGLLWELPRVVVTTAAMLPTHL